MNSDCAIVEFWEVGHRRYFVEAALRGGYPGKVLTSSELWSVLPEDLRIAHAGQFVVISGVHSSHFRQALAIRRFRRENPEIKRVVCMFLDDLYRELWLLAMVGCGNRAWLSGLGGVLFGNSKFHAASSSLRAKIKLRAQAWLLRWLAAATRTGKVLVHDDAFRAYLCAKGIPLRQLSFVPEPVNLREPSRPNGMVLPQSEKLTLGFFGAHAPHKGTVWALRALASSGLPVRAVVSGSYGDDPELLETCRAIAPEFEIITLLREKGVSEPEMLWMLAQVDVVVIPYRQFYGSSNILVHALRFGKRLLVTDSGVVGGRVRQLQCGAGFPEGDANAFVRCVASFGKVWERKDETSVAAFLENCTPTALAKTLAAE
jgi:glycosyltransferase involved in cell wall biosynthesis